MKQYASHYVWMAGLPLAKMQVISVDEDSHRVLSVSSFRSEQAHTIWLGGMILVAPSFPDLRAGESFLSYLYRLQGPERSSGPLYACHVEDYDLMRMEFRRTSRLIAL